MNVVALIFLGLIVCSVVTNILWYRTKFVLRSRGFPMSLFVHHLQDFANLERLIATEEDPVNRAKYARLRLALYISIAVTLVWTVCFFYIATTAN